MLSLQGGELGSGSDSPGIKSTHNSRRTETQAGGAALLRAALPCRDSPEGFGGSAPALQWGFGQQETHFVPVQLPVIPVQLPSIPVQLPTISVQLPRILVQLPVIPVQLPVIPVHLPM